MKQLEETVSDNSSRFTVIRKDGSVAADTGMVDTSSMDNHLDREEIKKRWNRGGGSSRRYSDTLKKNMLYVACVSDHSDYILRMAVPLPGLRSIWCFSFLQSGSAFWWRLCILPARPTVLRPLSRSRLRKYRRRC